MKPEKLFEWFVEGLLPILVKDGRLSENKTILSIKKCEFETIKTGVSSFASVPSYIKVILNTPAGETCRNIIIKFQSQDPVFRKKMKLILQFQNEVTMYMEVLPSFCEFITRCGKNKSMIQNIVPKCYFAMYKSDDLEKSIVVLKDLRKDGYRSPTAVTDLDLEHCLLAFEKLAQFHAVSYAMKFRRCSLFEKLKHSFVHVWLEDNQWTRNQCEDFKGCCSQRGIDFLMSQKNSEVPLDYLENLKKILEPKNLFDYLRSLHSPREPLSVICHGDFNRNNILYKYDNGKVVDAKLIDFQTFLYGSPCLDLSFFIYMNTTLQFRESHFEYIFCHYYSTLINHVSDILNESKESIIQRLPFETFKEDFSRVAITAYVTVAFFLPIMMAPAETDFVEDLKKKSFKELALENYAQGGEIVSERIAEVIIDFYRRKFYMKF